MTLEVVELLCSNMLGKWARLYFCEALLTFEMMFEYIFTGLHNDAFDDIQLWCRKISGICTDGYNNIYKYIFVKYNALYFENSSMQPNLVFLCF